MVDTSGQAEIRGIDIDKLAKGFAEEEILMKRFCMVTKASSREIRWYQKTAGFLDSTDTTGITASQIKSVAEGALPVVVEQSWTRNTSYVKKFFVETPMMSNEDIKDNDVDVLATNIHDLIRAIRRQQDIVIYDAITDGSGILTTVAVADGWDDIATGNPIKDILVARQKIRAQSYDLRTATLFINSIEELNLLNFLINVKGSSIPEFASDKVKTAALMRLLGVDIVVNELFTTDEATLIIPKKAVTWKQFTPLTTAVIDFPGIGKKVRIWEEGEVLLTDPKAVHVTTDTVV